MGRSKMIIRIFIFGLAFTLQLLFSTNIQTIDVRLLGQGATIAFSKSSPPIAALEDEQLAALGESDGPRGKMATLSKVQRDGSTEIRRRKRIAYFKPLKIEKPRVFARTLRAKELVVGVETEMTSSNPLIAVRTPSEASPEADALREWANADGSERSVQKKLEELIADAGPPIVPESVGTFVLKPAAPPSTSALGVLANPGVRADLPQERGPQVETVVGAIEVRDGLAILDPGQVRIFHRRDGALLAQGEFHFSSGEFRISMARETGGEVIAEVRSETDRVVGIGRLAASDVFRARRPILTVTPNGRSTVASVLSADGLGEALPVAGAYLQIDGLESLPRKKTNAEGSAWIRELDGGSQFEWIASKEGFWTSRTTGHADWPSQIRLFPDRMMSALFQTLGIEKFDRATGILWGQVKHRGVPLEGVRVSLEDGTGTPVYFSGPFPNNRLSGTSSNGQFAFFQLKPGVYQVRAQAKGVELPTKMVEVHGNNVTTLDVSTSKALSSQVQTFDGLSGEPITASVQLTGTHRLATASEGRLNLRFSEGVDPLMLDVFAGPQAFTSRVFGDRFVKQQRVPVVRADWVEGLLSQAGVPSGGMGRSLVVGFIQGKDFSAEAKISSGETSDDLFRPIYFDGQGQLLRGSERGIAGGGFIISNLPEGFVQLNIRSRAELNDDGTPSVFVQRMFLDSRVIGVLSKDLSR